MTAGCLSSGDTTSERKLGSLQLKSRGREPARSSWRNRSFLQYRREFRAKKNQKVSYKTFLSPPTLPLRDRRQHNAARNKSNRGAGARATRRRNTGRIKDRQLQPCFVSRQLLQNYGLRYAARRGILCTLDPRTRAILPPGYIQYSGLLT